MLDFKEVRKIDIKPEGLCFDLPFEEYRQFSGLNQTSLKQFIGPLNSKGSNFINEKAFLRGNAGHCLVLEPERFHQTYVPAPQGLRQRGKTGKERWKAFSEQHPGKIILTHNLWNQLISSERALAVHPRVSDWMSEGHGEISLFWEDPETLVSCKARLDWFNPTKNLILDLKFSKNCREDYCRKQISENHYDLQAAWYCQGISEVVGVFPDFILVFVETVKPHRIQCFSLSNTELEEGKRKIREAFKTMSITNHEQI